VLGGFHGGVWSLGSVSSATTSARAVDPVAGLSEPGKRGHVVGWWLNPSSTPVDLVSKLEAAGFSRVIEQAGLVLTDMEREIRCNPSVTVRKATRADRDELIRLYSVGYPVPEKWSAIYCDLLWLL